MSPKPPHCLLGQLRAARGHHRFLHLDLPPLPDGPVSGNPVAQGHQHQHHRVLGDGVSVAPLVVAHIDPPAPGFLQVHTVIGHPLRLNQPQAGQKVHNLPARIGNRVGEQNLGIRVGGRSLDRRLPQRAVDHLGRELPCKVGHIRPVALLRPKNQYFHSNPSCFGIQVSKLYHAFRPAARRKSPFVY